MPIWNPKPQVGHNHLQSLRPRKVGVFRLVAKALPNLELLTRMLGIAKYHCITLLQLMLHRSHLAPFLKALKKPSRRTLPLC